jgi:hypothetical protein
MRHPGAQVRAQAPACPCTARCWQCRLVAARGTLPAGARPALATRLMLLLSLLTLLSTTRLFFCSGVSCDLLLMVLPSSSCGGLGAIGWHAAAPWEEGAAASSLPPRCSGPARCPSGAGAATRRQLTAHELSRDRRRLYTISRCLCSAHRAPCPMAAAAAQQLTLSRTASKVTPKLPPPSLCAAGQQLRLSSGRRASRE